MASACCKQAWTTVVSPRRFSSGRTQASSSSHTLLRASRAYRRMLKLWLKHHCRLTSTARRHCTSWEKHQQYSSCIQCSYCSHRNKYYYLILQFWEEDIQVHEDREKSANACFCLLVILQNKELHGLQENVRHVYIICINKRHSGLFLFHICCICFLGYGYSPDWSSSTGSGCETGSGGGPGSGSTLSDTWQMLGCCRTQPHTRD